MSMTEWEFRMLDQETGAEMDRIAEAKEIIAAHRATVADDRALFDMADALLTVREVRWRCVFCQQEVPREWSACCGEVGHTEPMSEDDDENE